MTVEDIGARLVIDPGTAIATITELNAKVDQLNASLLKLGATADATMVKVGKTAEASAAEAGAATKAGAAASDAGAAGIVAAGAHGKALDEVAGKTDVVAKKTKTLSEQLQAAGSGTIAKAGMGALVAGVAVAGESIDQYMKYQKAMTQLVSQAALPAKRLPGMMTGGINIGKETGLNFSDIANQLYRITSAGAGLKETNKQILALGKGAADIAVLFNTTSGAPTEQIARLFGTLRNVAVPNKKGAALQDVGTNPQKIAALLNATVGTGDIRGQDLVGALGRGVLQSGQAVNAKLPDLLSWIDLSTHLGGQPSTSGTLIAHSIQQLAGGTEQAKKAEAMVGVTPSEMETLIRTKGIGAAVSDLYTKAQTWNPLSYFPATMQQAPGAASAMAQANAWLLASPADMQKFYNNTASPQLRQSIETQLFAKMFGGARQEIPFLSIAENQTKYAQIEAQIKAQSNVGTYKKDLAAAMGTPSQQLEIGLRNIQAYSIQLGKTLTPYLVTFVHGVVDAAKFLAGNKALLVGIGATIAAIAGLGSAVYIGGKIAKTAEELKKFFGVIGGISNKTLGTSFGTAGSAAPVTANTTALDENTAAISRLSEVMGIADTEGGIGGFGKGGGLIGTVASGGETAAEDIGGATVLSRLSTKLGAAGIGSSLLKAGLYGILASTIYNAVLKTPLSHLIGAGGAKTTGTALTGAAAGFGAAGPLGAVAGAALLPAITTTLNASRQPGQGGVTVGGISMDHQVLGTQNPVAIANWIKLHPGQVPANDLFGPQVAALIKSRLGAPAASTAKQTYLGAAGIYGSAVKMQGQSTIFSGDISALQGIQKEYGLNSSQYKQQLGWTEADMRKIFSSTGTGKTTQWNFGKGAVTPQQIMAAVAAHQATATTQAGYQSVVANLTKQANSQSLSNAIGRYGSPSQLKGQITQGQAYLKDLKVNGGSMDHIKGVETQIKTEQAHLKTIENLTQKVSKSTDISKATSTLEAAIKAKDTTQNSLLSQILGALKSLKVTVNVAPGTTTSAGGTVPNTSAKPSRK